jgi:peptidyl-prolyl isomerase E (cyclophilin E)
VLAGGLEESVTEATLRAAFVPFGEITDINLPFEGGSQKHKGFAFVQFDEKDDAADAIDNMNNAELFGRVIRVNLAKPDAMKGGHRPVWEARADDFFKDGGAAGGGD